MRFPESLDGRWWNALFSPEFSIPKHTKAKFCSTSSSLPTGLFEKKTCKGGSKDLKGERESQSEGIWVCSCKSWIVTMHSHGTVWSLVVGFKHILNSRLGLSFQRGDIKHKPHEPEIKSHCQCCMTLLKPSSWFLLHSRSIVRVHRGSSWPFWNSNASSDSKMKQGPCSFQSLENLINAVSKYVKVAVVAHHLYRTKGLEVPQKVSHHLTATAAKHQDTLSNIQLQSHRHGPFFVQKKNENNNSSTKSGPLSRLKFRARGDLETAAVRKSDGLES